MIIDGKNSHYLALKSARTTNGYNCPMRSFSRLFRGIASNNIGDCYCSDRFHSYRTNNSLKKHERLCDKHDYCHLEMPDEDNKILKYNHGDKSDLECLLKKVSSYQNNLEKPHTEKKLSMSLQVTQGV